MPTPPAGLAAETAPITRTVTDLLGAQLLGLYLYGSAVTSGLQYDSDLDFLAVTATALDDALRARLSGSLLRHSGPWPRAGGARPVEPTVVARAAVVPWRFPPRGEFVYGEWMRAEFERGAVGPPAPDPDLAILLGMVRDSSVALAGPPADRLLDPVPPQDLIRAVTESLPALTAGVDGDERNVVLTLARMWITAESETVVSKAEAARRLAARVPAAHAALLRRARDGYLGVGVDDWSGHRDEVAAIVRYAAAGIRAATGGGGREGR
ncbi:aminoglycoside adenylyltransferase family protein [Nocardia sp. NPDC004568]|uniref:aminoglycoside adenylyltransferase family protein n=1 Tax=Nocardia sp. NPDC004568 TaxID=3154551 RepID=UPI0033A08531